MTGWTSSFLLQSKMADGEYCRGTNVLEISVCTKGVKQNKAKL